MLAQIQKEYPEEVRIVYRHFPLIDIHDKAQLSAEAAEAAGAQGKFWEMHDLLYATQTNWAEMTPEAFRQLLDIYAIELQLDGNQFATQLDGGKFKPQVDVAYTTAAQIGLPGTPFILYNGAPYQGPQDHWAFVALIKLEQLKARQFSAPPPAVIDPAAKYYATLHTERGKVVVELFADQTPLTVNNFVFLAQNGWFDNTTFHRVLPGFVIQSGDPTGTGFGGPGYYIDDEIIEGLNFDAAGWIGMANAGPNTNGSQFFITLGPTPDLSGKYTLFGKVISGLEVLNKISPRDPSADPEAAPGDILKSVTISNEAGDATPKLLQWSSPPTLTIDANKTYAATLNTARGKIVIELLPQEAPITVNNFVFLARQGYYDGVTFHRVLPGFVAQGGDPTGTGSGGPGYFIPNEDSALRFEAAGVVAMANSGRDRNGSQFFITYAPLPALDGGYTIFGRVTAGLDVALAITPRDPATSPNAPPGDVIQSVTITEK